ncbi:MAG: cbb3-type cytochrome c oxidase N-terminal domain-containing protein [Myxococcota bacterium]
MSERTTPAEDPQRDLLIDDHNYDGIQEYDNPLPKWWTYIFFGTFVFSVGYGIHYLVGSGAGIHDDYLAEMEAFEKAEEKRLMAMGDVSEDVLSQMASNASSITKGKETYASVCQQCHGAQGEGKIGPNLTDEAWIHGDGSMMAIYGTVADGVLAKGMPEWKKQLSPTDLRSVVAYLGSIRNTNVPGKEPQGTVPGKLVPPRPEGPSPTVPTEGAPEPPGAPTEAPAGEPAANGVAPSADPETPEPHGKVGPAAGNEPAEFSDRPSSTTQYRAPTGHDVGSDS